MKFLTLALMIFSSIYVYADDPVSCDYKYIGTNRATDSAMCPQGMGCYEVEPGEHTDVDDDEQERRGIFGNKEDGQWCERDKACLSGICEKIVVEHHTDKDGNEDHGTDHDKCKWRKRCVPKSECMYAAPGEKAPGDILCDNSENPFIVKNSENVCEPAWDSVPNFTDLGLIGSVNEGGGVCALNLQTGATDTYLNNFVKLAAFEYLFYRKEDAPNEARDCFGMAKRASVAAGEFKTARDNAAVTFSELYQKGYLATLKKANDSQNSLDLQCLPPKALRDENRAQMKLNKDMIDSLKNLYNHVRYLRQNYTWKEAVGRQWKNPHNGIIGGVIDNNNSKTRKNSWNDDEFYSNFGVPVWGDGGKHDCRRRSYHKHMRKAWHHRMKLGKNVFDDVPITINGDNINMYFGQDIEKAALIDPFFPEGTKWDFKKDNGKCGNEKYRRKCKKDHVKNMYYDIKNAAKEYFKNPAVSPDQVFKPSGNASADEATKAFIQSQATPGLNFLGIKVTEDDNDPLLKILTDETFLAVMNWSYNSKLRIKWKTYKHDTFGSAMSTIGKIYSNWMLSTITFGIVGGKNRVNYLRHYVSNRIEYLNNLELAIVEMIVYLEKVNQLRFQVATCYNGVMKDLENICNPQGNGLGNGTDYTQGGEEQATGSTGHIDKKDKKVTVNVTGNKLGGLKLNSAAMLDDKKFGSGLGKNLDEATLTSNIGDQLASDLKKRYQDSISKLSDKDKALIDAFSNAKKADFMRLQEATLKPDGNSSSKNNKQGAVGIVAAPSKEEKKDNGPVASSKPAAKGAPATSTSPKFDFGLDKDSSGSSNSSSEETTNHEETDAMLSETKSDKYKSDENDDLFTSISKAYVREGFPRLLKRKSSLEKTETQKTENKGLDKIQDLE